MNTRQLKKWGIIALTLIIITALAYYFLKPTPQAPNHITAIAEIGDIEQTVIATGKVKAINTVNVGAQVSGEIQTLYVKVGDVVEKGDLIAQIDQVNQRTSLQNATSSLSQSRFEQSSALAELNSRHAALESAKADLQSQQALAKQARTNLQRLKPLIGIDAISQQEHDNAVAQADTADAAVAKAKANISQMQAAIAQAQANIANQKESVNKANSNLSQAQENLGKTTIRAPISGTVVSVVTEQGSTVNAMQSAPTIVKLADLSQIRINAQISEADVVNVSAGMPVYFNLIGAPDKRYDATLKGIEPAPESISNTSATNSAVYYTGYLEVPNPEHKFRIDMTAQLNIIVNQAKNAVLIPSAALIEQPNKTLVKVLDADGNVLEKVVSVGINNRVQAQILRGINQGDTVILSEDSTINSIDASTAQIRM